MASLVLSACRGVTQIYILPFLKSRHSEYKVTVVRWMELYFRFNSLFHHYIFKFAKQCHFIFGYYTLKVWNDFPDDVHSATFPSSFRNKCNLEFVYLAASTNQCVFKSNKLVKKFLISFSCEISQRPSKLIIIIVVRKHL